MFLGVKVEIAWPGDVQRARARGACKSKACTLAHHAIVAMVSAPLHASFWCCGSNLLKACSTTAICKSYRGSRGLPPDALLPHASLRGLMSCCCQPKTLMPPRTHGRKRIPRRVFGLLATLCCPAERGGERARSAVRRIEERRTPQAQAPTLCSCRRKPLHRRRASMQSGEISAMDLWEDRCLQLADARAWPRTPHPKRRLRTPETSISELQDAHENHRPTQIYVVCQSCLWCRCSV